MHTFSKMAQAEVIDIGWIKVKDDSKYINLNSASNGLVIGTAKTEFKFVISPTQHGAYGLLASQTLSHAVKATGSAHSTDASSRAISVVPMPSGVTAGDPIPTITNADQYLFAITRNGNDFDIKSKKLAGSYVFTMRGTTAPNNDIAASADAGRNGQRWTFKSQQSTATMPKFVTAASRPLPAGATAIGYVTPQYECVSDASPKIIDGKWVAVSLGMYGSIHAGAEDPKDSSKTCYKFTMKTAGPGFKKDRNELSRCFTRLSDFQRLSTSTSDIGDLTTCRWIYSLSPKPETRCDQGSHMRYSFKILVKEWKGSRANINVIFAQWHGMPNSLFFKVPRSASTPSAPLYDTDGPKTPADAVSIWNTYDFKAGVSTTNHTKLSSSPPIVQYRYVEQGGKPPLAMKFKDDKLQVVCTGDARYFSDKYVPGTNTKFRPTSAHASLIKTETLYDAMSLSAFPLRKWVTFDVDVKWAEFNSGSDGTRTKGSVKIDMTYAATAGSAATTTTLLNKSNLLIGRNDSLGYYFKFGCYRHSTERITFFLKDYSDAVV